MYCGAARITPTAFQADAVIHATCPQHQPPSNVGAPWGAVLSCLHRQSPQCDPCHVLAYTATRMARSGDDIRRADLFRLQRNQLPAAILCYFVRQKGVPPEKAADLQARRQSPQTIRDSRVIPARPAAHPKCTSTDDLAPTDVRRRAPTASARRALPSPRRSVQRVHPRAAPAADRRDRSRRC